MPMTMTTTATAGTSEPRRCLRMRPSVSRHHLGVSSDPQYGKYARPECERRFLLSGVPAEATAPRRITDRYFRSTRLRLRRMEREGEAPVYKFGQKVRPHLNDPSVVMITNVY